MTFAEIVAADIASIGGSKSVTLHSATEAEDAYGNVTASYDGGTAYIVLISRIPHDEQMQVFGTLTGEAFKVYFPATASAIKEHDRVTFGGNNYKIHTINVVYYENAATSHIAFVRREVSG